jgi:hypothetical protein
MPVWGELLELLGTATLDEEGNAELELGATDELLGEETTTELLLRASEEELPTLGLEPLGQLLLN